MSAAHGEQVLLLEEHGQEGARSIEWWGMMFFIASGLTLVFGLPYLAILAGIYFLRFRGRTSSPNS